MRRMGKIVGQRRHVNIRGVNLFPTQIEGWF
jgi:hypothetical protein